MSWVVLDRSDAKYDFEDWRAAEDSEIRPEDSLDPDGSVAILTTRFHNKVHEAPAGSLYAYFWQMNDELRELWSGDDDNAMHADDTARQFAQQGNPEAIGFMAETRVQLGKYDEAARWIARLNFLVTTGEMYPLPAGEDFLDYRTFLQTLLETARDKYEAASGRTFDGSQLADVGPAAEGSFCETCGVKLLTGVENASCKGFYFNFLFDLVEKPTDLLSLLTTHDLELEKGEPNPFTRWPAGVPGKLGVSTQERSVPKAKFCTQCGSATAEGALFCAQCGNRVQG